MEKFFKQEIKTGVYEYHSNLERKKKEILKVLFNEDILNEYEREKVVDGLLNELIESEAYGEIIDLGKQALASFEDRWWVESLEKLNTTTVENAVLLTEAINWGAKTLDNVLYELKPAMIISAWKMGAVLGVEREEGRWPIYYLHAPNVGVASFHDPDSKVDLINERINQKQKNKDEIMDWTHGWSQVPRQNEAFKLIQAMAHQIDNEEKKHYLRKMALRTSPGKNLYERFKNSKDPNGFNNYNDGKISNRIKLN